MSSLADGYGGYADLASAQAEETDYRVHVRPFAGSSIAVIAPHGGGIEQFTSDIARAVEKSCYRRNGLKSRASKFDQEGMPRFTGKPGQSLRRKTGEVKRQCVFRLSRFASSKGSCVLRHCNDLYSLKVPCLMPGGRARFAMSSP